MSMFGQHARVRDAQLRMSEARRAVATPASALLARGERHPLVVLGVAAGVGLVMGRMHVHPMRVPGMSGLISGVMNELAALGAGFLAHAAAATDDA